MRQRYSFFGSRLSSNVTLCGGHALVYLMVESVTVQPRSFLCRFDAGADVINKLMTSWAVKVACDRDKTTQRQCMQDITTGHTLSGDSMSNIRLGISLCFAKTVEPH